MHILLGHTVLHVEEVLSKFNNKQKWTGLVVRTVYLPSPFLVHDAKLDILALGRLASAGPEFFPRNSN